MCPRGEGGRVGALLVCPRSPSTPTTSFLPLLAALLLPSTRTPDPLIYSRPKPRNMPSPSSSSTSPSRSHAGYYQFSNPPPSYSSTPTSRSRPSPLDLCPSAPSSPTPSNDSSYSSSSSSSKVEIKAKLEPLLFAPPPKGSWKRALFGGNKDKYQATTELVEKGALSDEEVEVAKEMWAEYLARSVPRPLPPPCFHPSERALTSSF